MGITSWFGKSPDPKSTPERTAEKKSEVKETTHRGRVLDCPPDVKEWMKRTLGIPVLTGVEKFTLTITREESQSALVAARLQSVQETMQSILTVQTPHADVARLREHPALRKLIELSAELPQGRIHKLITELPRSVETNCLISQLIQIYGEYFELPGMKKAEPSAQKQRTIDRSPFMSALLAFLRDARGIVPFYPTCLGEFKGIEVTNDRARSEKVRYIIRPGLQEGVHCLLINAIVELEGE